ncbi:hypothetical protein AGDE_14096 [Angomonas deanei]|nr:hypothetical protein AGDE_14096 [Angomonas deanei]|eukprot:EPY21424.1 hypothetical protein AGDE_14096 [Angomonas deanei]
MKTCAQAPCTGCSSPSGDDDTCATCSDPYVFEASTSQCTGCIAGTRRTVLLAWRRAARWRIARLVYSTRKTGVRPAARTRSQMAREDAAPCSAQWQIVPNAWITRKISARAAL